MNNTYKVEIISKSEKDSLIHALYSSEMHQHKAEIHGTCVKFFTDNAEFKEMWENNFKPMPEYIRPHARLFAVSDQARDKRHKTNSLRVLYEPISKTVIVKNCSYYGWIKSIALALTADFFEDFTSEHRRYSIHGSFVDFGGKGIGIIGPSGSGKTTLTYGLLLEKHANFVTDDWFFVRFMDDDVLTFSSEKNSYVRDDIAKNWHEFAAKLHGLKKDNQGRSIVDVKQLFGEEKIRERSVLGCIVLLKRDKRKNAGPVFAKLKPTEALSFMLKNDFCNPHQLIRNARKLKERTAFFAELFKKVPVYILNTVETPGESLERIKALISTTE